MAFSFITTVRIAFSMRKFVDRFNDFLSEEAMHKIVINEKAATP